MRPRQSDSLHIDAELEAFASIQLTIEFCGFSPAPHYRIAVPKRVAGIRASGFTDLGATATSGSRLNQGVPTHDAGVREVLLRGPECATVVSAIEMRQFPVPCPCIDRWLIDWRTGAFG